jgi:hypothetical protein
MANTAFKIVDHLAQIPSSQFNVEFPSGYEPLNEQQTATMKWNKDSYPLANLLQIIDYGLGDRPITLQGLDLSDDDRYTLRNAVENPRIKQLYLGDDYYYYVRGVEGRIIRDVGNPLLYSYTCAFSAVDPYMYDSSAIGTNQVSEAGGDIKIPTSGNLGGKVYLEPLFWIENESGHALTFTDDRGCRLTFTPPDEDVWIVMPWFNYNVQGFMPDYPIAYKAKSWTMSDVTTSWALDVSIEAASPQFLRTSGNFIAGGASLSLSDTNTPKIYQTTNMYPRAFPGRNNNIAVTNNTGTAIYAQWRVRK